MIVNLKYVLTKAKLERRAVPAFNVYDLETIMAVLGAAKKNKSPVIISFGESYFDQVPIEIIAEIVKNLAANCDFDIVLHLDHAKEFQSIIRAMRCGFTSVMYDGSANLLEDNIINTAEIVKIAHAADVSVEAELGYMNPEDGSSSSENCNLDYTDAKIARRFVLDTKVDALAIAVGNAHGIYKFEPHLDFDRIKEIKNNTDIPLVLHGCSGIPEASIKKAISLGICKINVNTEVSVGGVEAIRKLLNENSGEKLRLEKVLKHACNEMCRIIESYITLANG